MKKLYILLFLILNVVLRAQTPQKIGYQAVVRDERGDLVTNRNVGVRITILQNGMEVYQETHTPQTNANGLFSIEIGNGAVLHGVFGAIEWSEGECSVKTDIDLMGGTSYTLTSTTEALSIPYAMHAQTAQRLVENPQESDPIFVASVAKNITDTNVQYWNKKLDSADLEVLKIEVQTKVDSAYVNSKLQSLETGVDTALLNALLAKIEMLEKTVEDLQIDLQIANGTLVKDIDGNVYKTQKYGNQTWMVENLRVSKYNDGTVIDYVQNNETWRDKHDTVWRQSGSYTYSDYEAPPMYSFSDTSADGKIKYGALYTWKTVDPTNGKQLCPIGWRVPSIDEWDILRQKLIVDGYNYDGTTAGNKIGKSMAAENGWEYSNIEGSAGNTDYSAKKNASKFSAYPAGSRIRSGVFSGVGQDATYWSTTSSWYYGGMFPSFLGRYATINYDRADLFICPNGTLAIYGNSIRCVKE